MANKIIESGLGDLEELWGLRDYACTTQTCTQAQRMLLESTPDSPAIIDFKQSNKPKRREWILDYFEQLGAYAMAHNQVYGTEIQSGIVLMCTKDFLFSEV